MIVGIGGWSYQIIRMLDNHHNRQYAQCDFIGGWTELPPPATQPHLHRFLLQSLVQVALGIGYRQVNLPALDAAYSLVFPSSTPLNVSKKRRE